MRTIIEALQAGVPSVYNIAGSHLEILSAEFPLSVSIQDANGVEITNGKSENVQAGTYFVPRQGFDRFVLTSALSQDVQIGVSFGESGTRRVAGTVTIAGTPSVNVANPDAQKRYDEYGASFKSTASTTVNVPETIISPAANVNGAIVWAASFHSRCTNSGGVAAIVAKASAPSNIVDGDVLFVSESSVVFNSAAYQSTHGRLLRPIKIPAGKGLYYIAGFNDDGVAAGRSVLYTLL